MTKHAMAKVKDHAHALLTLTLPLLSSLRGTLALCESVQIALSHELVFHFSGNVFCMQAILVS